MLDLFCIGESLCDVFYLLQEASIQHDKRTGRSLLCLGYGEKIPVNNVIKTPAAGNSANAAVASARMGLKTGLLTWIGNDAMGKELHQALRDEQIDLKHVVTDHKNPTTESVILHYQEEKTQLINFQPRNYVLPSIPATKAVYYSAMGKPSKKFDRDLFKHLTAHPEIFFTFQPGTTHVRGGLEAIQELIERSQLFILNLAEARELFQEPRAEIQMCLERFQEIGAEMVVITDGIQGAFARTEHQNWHMKAIPVPVKEMTGAGDAFASTLTIGLLQQKTLPEALHMGAVQSANVIQHVGPQKGLLSAKEMTKQVKKYARVKASVIPLPSSFPRRRESSSDKR